MLISPTPPMQKVALEVPGVRQMALEIAHHFPAPGERRETESLEEYMARCVASMKLAAAIASVNPEAASVILKTLTSR